MFGKLSDLRARGGVGLRWPVSRLEARRGGEGDADRFQSCIWISPSASSSLAADEHSGPSADQLTFPSRLEKENIIVCSADSDDKYV